MCYRVFVKKKKLWSLCMVAEVDRSYDYSPTVGLRYCERERESAVRFLSIADKRNRSAWDD